jgi:antibiotic biosynthesis monooxygenase (ABM) superfamily enzyme
MRLSFLAFYYVFGRRRCVIIARVWYGYTKPQDTDAYEAMLKPELLPGIRRFAGYRGSYLLRREAGEEIEFVTILLWDSIDAIRAVAGPDYEAAVIPEERRKYLSRYDAKSAHYEIVATDGLASGPRV